MIYCTLECENFKNSCVFMSDITYQDRRNFENTN
jgi:hypothetical protein